MTVVRATPAHAQALALIHAAAFPPAQRWDLDALTLQLSLPGAYGFASLHLLPSGKGRGKGGFAAEEGTADADGTRPGWDEDRPSPPPRPDPFPEKEGAASGGFILVRVAADEAEVLTFAVTPAAQGRGLGRKLLAAALGHAHSIGVVSMFLEVSPANAPALALYAGAGFVPVGCRTRYYPGGEDALVLRCPVTPAAAAAGGFRPAAG